MAVSITSIEGVLVDFPTTQLPNVIGELTMEALIELHQILSSNVSSVIYNLRGGRYGHLALTIVVDN